ncbi:hypothetical protein KUH03_34125 [Sphingobacterium sp. E70]|uniref:hypothetical protein n=1 Tax=Sphingobacterium sp. E70 TaxID=2853439 RepID=UPI00211C922D|nr:hypothetical protein [Sphingobacterium sp. E70]ULT24074.1 hypothetical protein KUH03_34125 [Sphingobacterium sp. E70]
MKQAQMPKVVKKKKKERVNYNISGLKDKGLPVYTGNPLSFRQPDFYSIKIINDP